MMRLETLIEVKFLNPSFSSRIHTGKRARTQGNERRTRGHPLKHMEKLDVARR